MLMRTDPFRELDRLTQQAFGSPAWTWSRPTAMAMDAYRAGDQFVVAFDLPRVNPDAIELDVERNVAPEDQHLERRRRAEADQRLSPAPVSLVVSGGPSQLRRGT